MIQDDVEGGGGNGGTPGKEQEGIADEEGPALDPEPQDDTDEDQEGCDAEHHEMRRQHGAASRAVGKVFGLVLPGHGPDLDLDLLWVPLVSPGWRIAFGGGDTLRAWVKRMLRIERSTASTSKPTKICGRPSLLVISSDTPRLPSGSCDLDNFDTWGDRDHGQTYAE